MGGEQLVQMPGDGRKLGVFPETKGQCEGGREQLRGSSRG